MPACRGENPSDTRWPASIHPSLGWEEKVARGSRCFHDVCSRPCSLGSVYFSSPPFLGMTIWGMRMAGWEMMGYCAGFGFLVLLLLVVAAVRSYSAPWPGTTSSHDPMDVLKRRLAQGEITRQEYEELKQTFHA